MLAACAVTPDFPARIERPADSAPDRFELSGRIGVRYDEDGYSGNARWQHGANSDRIWLNSPLGQTVAYLERDAGGVTLTADGKTYRAADAETLTGEVLGWTLPLAGLEHWVLGRIAPNDKPTVVERDASGRLTRLTQNAWQISFPRYAEPPYSARPARIELQYGNLTIKLVVDDWGAE